MEGLENGDTVGEADEGRGDDTEAAEADRDEEVGVGVEVADAVVDAEAGEGAGSVSPAQPASARDPETSRAQRVGVRATFSMRIATA